MALEFEWDASKAKINLTKHGIVFEEGLTVFRDPLAKIFDDPDHSSAETREIIRGARDATRVSVRLYAGTSEPVRRANGQGNRHSGP